MTKHREDWEKPVMVSFQIPQYLLTQLDEYAAKFKQKRSDLIRESIAVSINKWHDEGR